MMRTPAFWSHDGLASRLLLPLSWCYGTVAARRHDRHPYRCPVPVICIGNVTAGGSGKTPVAQALMRAATDMGLNAHFLSRGYGGSLRGPVQVDPARHAAPDVGDEPLLLAAMARTWVSRDRAAGAKAAAQAGAHLIIMDDGLQNPHIVKDVSVLVIDGGFGFGNGRLLPAGPLREPVEAAMARVDFVLAINNSMSPRALATGPSRPANTDRLVPRSSRGMTVENMMLNIARIASAPHNLQGKPLIAFAGLGRPAKFRETLESEGAHVLEFYPFGDHHAYTARELDRLLAASRKRDAMLVTTEKDYVRLPAGFCDHVTPLPITLVFDDPALPKTLIRKAMAR